MNLETLKYLKDKGFKYLLCRFGKTAFVPLRKIPDKISDTPLAEDELVSIEDTIEFGDCEELLHRMIILR